MGRRQSQGFYNQRTRRMHNHGAFGLTSGAGFAARCLFVFFFLLFFRSNVNF